LRQTPLHLSLLSARPSRLPKLFVRGHSLGHTGGVAHHLGHNLGHSSADQLLRTMAPEQLACMVNVEDSFGFNPLQRVHDMHQHTRKDTVERKLTRHMLDWCADDL
jgi:hypothetical protein